jgi:hypothetical protein
MCQNIGIVCDVFAHVGRLGGYRYEYAHVSKSDRLVIGHFITLIRRLAHVIAMRAAYLLLPQATSLPLPSNHPFITTSNHLLTHNQNNKHQQTNTKMSTDLLQPPAYVNIPAYTYEPPTHSYGTGMVGSSTAAVSASSFAGGYNDVERPRIEDMGATEYRNHLRLITLIWGSNDKQVIDSILHLEQPKCNHAKFLSKQLAKRFSAQ